MHLLNPIVAHTGGGHLEEIRHKLLRVYLSEERGQKTWCKRYKIIEARKKRQILEHTAQHRKALFESHVLGFRYTFPA